MKRAALGVVLILSFLGAKCAGVKPDSVMAAIEAGDATAMVEGCGNQLVPGYTYCRVKEGEVAGGILSFVVPRTDCLRDGPCAFITVYFPNGEPSVALSVPRGTTRANLAWQSLLHRTSFEKDDRGFWPFLTMVYWIDLEGREQVSKAEGEIRLRVYSKRYVPLHESADDPDFVWKWNELGVDVKATTGLRTYVGKSPLLPLR